MLIKKLKKERRVRRHLEERLPETTTGHVVTPKVESPTALNNNEKLSKQISCSNGKWT